MTYETTPKQEQAIRDWLQEAIVPLIEQVLVKKLGQAMSFAAEQVVEPKRKPLTDEQILSLVPGLQDCLCDPWDYNNSGDYYASIPKDMIRLARAIEAAHGIKENT